MARARRDRRQRRQAPHSAKFSDMKLNTASVDVAGDYAIETGSVEWTVTPKGRKGDGPQWQVSDSLEEAG